MAALAIQFLNLNEVMSQSPGLWRDAATLGKHPPNCLPPGARNTTSNPWMFGMAVIAIQFSNLNEVMSQSPGLWRDAATLGKRPPNCLPPGARNTTYNPWMFGMAVIAIQFLNLNEVMSHSPGLWRDAATLGKRPPNSSQPQRGCVGERSCAQSGTPPRWGRFDDFGEHTQGAVTIHDASGKSPSTFSQQVPTCWSIRK